MPMVEHGHKHVLVLTFLEKLPAILALLPSELNRGIDGAIRLGLCSSADFSAIAERTLKVLSLSAQYGAYWWKHDPESN